jgi:hypothetical protein
LIPYRQIYQLIVRLTIGTIGSGNVTSLSTLMAATLFTVKVAFATALSLGAAGEPA